MWEQLSAEQKQNYGEDYFERALRSLEKYTEKVMIFHFECFHRAVGAKLIPFFDLITLNRTPIWDQQSAA